MRRLCTILAVLSLLLCLGIAALWIRSYWRNDLFWTGNQRTSFNVKAEANLNQRRLPTRLLAERDRDAWLLKSGRGILMLVQARYHVRPEEKDGWVEKLESVPPGPAETNYAETNWMSWWRDVGGPSWPDAQSLMGVNPDFANRPERQEGRDLRRMTEREHLRAKTPIRFGFGYVRWRHDDAGKPPQAAGHVTFDARGLAFPYWLPCLLSLAAAFALLLLRHRLRKRVVRTDRARARILPAVAALSAILLLLTGLLWARSHWRRHMLHMATNRLLFADEITPPMESKPHPTRRDWKRAGSGSRRDTHVDALPAGLRWHRRHTEFDYRQSEGWVEPGRPGMIRRWDVSSYPRERFVASLSNSRRFLGFEYATERSWNLPLSSAQHRLVLVPWWFLMLVFSIAPALFAWRVVRQRKRMRAERGLCVNCGYDLRATPDRCPECGMEAQSPRKGSPQRSVAS